MFKKAAFFLPLLLIPATLLAAEPGHIDSGDTAWMLVSAALVMFMTPGLALFYGGMVRSKNVLGTIMHSFIALGTVSLQWIFIGYSLSFGPDIGGLIGGLDWMFLHGVGTTPHPTYGPTIPHLAFMIYQAMFAIITPALISGAFAERMKFSAFLIYTIAWTTIVYDPVAHWIWGGGWMSKFGVLDFAGGIVVHVTSGCSALAAALYIGKRKGYLVEPMPPHNLPFTVLGAGILWFGWFGFNAGSALASGAVSANAFVTTNTAASSAMVTWMIIEWYKHGRPTMFGVATGAIAGLATITPASGFVSVASAFIIGVAAGLVCYTALNLKTRLGYDDSLDAFGVHGVGGSLGTICAGIFATVAVNSAGANGLIHGNPRQFIVQVLSVAFVALLSFGLSLLLLKIIDSIVGLRVEEDEEREGIDITQHGESGYYF